MTQEFLCYHATHFHDLKKPRWIIVTSGSGTEGGKGWCLDSEWGGGREELFRFGADLDAISAGFRRTTHTLEDVPDYVAARYIKLRTLGKLK